MLFFLWLSATLITLSTACVDLLFVVDPKDEHAIGRAAKVASDIEGRRLLTAAVTNRGDRILTRMTKDTNDLITTLENAHGPYERILEAVSVEILRRRSEKTLIVLLFTEMEVNSTLTTRWKEMKHTPVYVFRVGTAKAIRELFANEAVSFNKLIECKENVETKNTEIRRRQPSEVTERGSALTTSTRSPARSTGIRKPGPVFKGTTTSPRITTIDHLTTQLPTAKQDVGKTTKSPSPKVNTKTTGSRKPGPVFKGTTGAIRAPIIEQTTPIPSLKHGIEKSETVLLSSNTKSKQGIVLLKHLTSSIKKVTTTPSATTESATTTRRAPPGCAADILFLVDFSKGTGENSQSYFDIAASAIGVLPIGPDAVRVAMVGYSGPGRATTLFHLDKHDKKDDLIEEMFRMQASGGTTRTAEALRYARTEFDHMQHGARKGAKRVIVLFSDGYSQDDPIVAANEARREGIQIVTVSASGKYPPNEDELRGISGSKELVLIAPKGHQIREKILGRACAL